MTERTTNKKVKQMKCKQCDKWFHKAWKLAQHVKSAHPKRTDAELLMASTGANISEVVKEMDKMVPQSQPQYQMNYCPNCGVHLSKLDLY